MPRNAKRTSTVKHSALNYSNCAGGEVFYCILFVSELKQYGCHGECTDQHDITGANPTGNRITFIKLIICIRLLKMSNRLSCKEKIIYKFVFPF